MPCISISFIGCETYRADGSISRDRRVLGGLEGVVRRPDPHEAARAVMNGEVVFDPSRARPDLE